MRFALPSRLVMTVTAATIAMTSFTAAPVYADDDRAARAVAAILGLAVVGAIINDSKDDRKKVHRHVPQRKVYTHRQVQHKRIQKQRQRQRIEAQRRAAARHHHNGGQRRVARN
jgi:hypothetical protein